MMISMRETPGVIDSLEIENQRHKDVLFVLRALTFMGTAALALLITWDVLRFMMSISKALEGARRWKEHMTRKGTIRLLIS